MLKDRAIGLALSGGGVRAAAFHAGVLRRLAELGALENLCHVSSVSGGSLLVGLMLRTGGYQWPGSAEFLAAGYEHIRSTLTSVSLLGHAVRALLLEPRNWRFLLSRANVVATSIAACWDIRAKLGELPAQPIWSINATTGEDGRRFRFRGVSAGDGDVGYALVASYPLAEAMAVSAAYPVGIGPLRMVAADYRWRRRDTWERVADEPDIPPPLRKLHLYDGGLYDNLGLEPLWNMGSRRIRASAGPIDCVIVSDASALLRTQPIPGPLNLSRAARLMDIVSAQARALRVRAFVNALRTGEVSGLYLPIGAVAGTGLRPDSPPDSEDDDGTDWSVPLNPAQVAAVAGFRTTLGRIDVATFDLIARHGYETLQWREHRLRPLAAA